MCWSSDGLICDTKSEQVCSVPSKACLSATSLGIVAMIAATAVILVFRRLVMAPPLLLFWLASSYERASPLLKRVCIRRA